MAPNISNKSVYIIFIISINIVSMVCHYQPIKISHLETERNKYYLYLDYLDEETEYSKLDYRQFFDSIFNHEYKFSHHYDNKEIMQSEIQNFCNDDEKYIPFDTYKAMNQIVLLGSNVRKCRECLKEDSGIFNAVKDIYENHKKLEPHQKIKLNQCIGNFKESIETVFDKFDEGLFKFDLDEKTIGNAIVRLLNIVTAGLEEDYFTKNKKNEKLEYFQYFFKEIIIPEHTYAVANSLLVIIDQYDDKKKTSCYYSYKDKTIDYYVPMPEIFEGLDNYDDFIEHSKIKIKYLETLEGPLINNKELYKIYLDQPISKNDYEKLREPIPLPHETMYSVYSLRLQKLGYFPLHESTWTAEMEKLLENSDRNTIFTRHGIKDFIEDIMKIEDNLITYEI